MTPRVYGQLRKSSSPPTDKEKRLGKFIPVQVKPRDEPVPGDWEGSLAEWNAAQEISNVMARDNPDYLTTPGLIEQSAIETFILSEPLLNTAYVFTTQAGGWLWLLWWDGEEHLFVAEKLTLTTKAEVRDPSLQTLLARIEPLMTTWKIKNQRPPV